MPDVTFGTLLGRLAAAKGDNIVRRVFNHFFHYLTLLQTVILDCCYSGSVGSSGINTKNMNNLRSQCVVLAACEAAESAWEFEGRGFFTKALLDVLVACGTDNLTYQDLVQYIPTLSR